MKLLIVLSLIACAYAAKLDRTYLPPSSAATAGGSPGALNTLVGPSESAGFGQPAANSGFGQPAAFGPSNSPAFGKSTSGPDFGFQPGIAPSSLYGQPGSPSGNFDPGFTQVAQNFGPSAQGYQRNQPQRSQAAVEQNAETLRSDSQNDGNTFSYNFETSNGITAEESGVATNGVQAQGAFSYSDDDGQNFRVMYTADENGYLPQGDHLPTPHPIPEDIIKSIEKNAEAAASGTQEGAYNPNEDNSVNAPQPYNYNAPSSYNQGLSGSSNQQGSGPSQIYGSPNTGSAASYAQSGNQKFQPQSPAQQYTASNTGARRPTSGLGQIQQSPSQSYGSPSNDAGSRAQSSSQARPSSFGQNQLQSQGPSQQYGASSRPGANGGSNGFAPLNPASQLSSNQYQSPQSGFPAAERAQGPAQQAQDDSGYQYNSPQNFGQDSNGKLSNQGPVNQYRFKNGGSQPFRPQASFPRSNSANTGYLSSPVQGPFGPSSGSNTGSLGPLGPKTSSSQGSFGLSPSSFNPSAGSSGQGSFGSVLGQGSFGPSGSIGQSSFGPSSGAFGTGRPQGSVPSTYTKGAMPESGYSYNRPGSQSGAGPQGNVNAPGSRPGQNFGGPRQPPSFSEEEGYKY